MMPAGVLLTVPRPLPVTVPFPALLTVRLTPCESLNVAVTIVVEVRVSVQAPVPVHPPPLQPANVEPVAGLAVSVTVVPPAKDPEQFMPQLIWGGAPITIGALTTVPLPGPAFTTARLAVGRSDREHAALE
jgi:hypothetical protein